MPYRTLLPHRLRRHAGIWLCLSAIAATLATAYFVESSAAAQARETATLKLTTFAAQIALGLDRSMLLAGVDVSKRRWFVNALRKQYVGDVNDAKLLASKLPNPTGDRWPDGGDWLAAYSRTKGFQSYPGLGWTVVVRQGVDEALAPAKTLRDRVLWSGFAVALLCLAFGFAPRGTLSRT